MLTSQLRTMTVPLLAGLSLAGAAQAEESPYYLGGSLGLTHVSNIYRSTPGQPRNNDTVSTATLLAGLDQRIGRQRLFGDVSVRANHYTDNSDLSNTGYALNAGLDWQTVERLSGQLSVNSNRALAQFNPGNAPAISKKNIEQTDQARASLRYGLASLLTLEGSLTHRQRDYSASEYDAYDYQQDTVSLGLSYRPSAKLQLGVATRYSEGSYPHYRLLGGAYQADKFKRHDLDLTGSWTASGASVLSARLSASKADHSEASTRDFSGATGLVSWRWQPTAKLLINTSVSRDSGVDSSFLSFGQLGGIASDYSRITTAAQLNASYELSSKITLEAGVSRAKRDLTSSFGNQVVDGADTSTGLSLAARWQVRRNALLGCQINRDERTGSSFLSLPYSATSYGCYAQALLR